MSGSKLILVALFVCLFASPVFAGFSQTQNFRPATPAELAMKGVDYAPGVPAAILDWVKIDDDTQAFSSEYYRIKIFSDEGKKYGDVEISYAPFYPISQRVTDISARTIQPDGTIVPFDGKIYDKVLYKSGRASLRAKTFSLAGVQPGSIIEYRFQRRWNQALLFSTLWSIQREIPVLHMKLSLKPYDSSGEYGSYFTYFNLPPGKLPAKVRNQWELELENAPIYQAEEFAPPEDQLKSRVNFYYTDSRIQMEKFWEAQSVSWNKTIEGFIGKPDALRAVAQPLIGNSPMETLQNVYAKVQSLKNLSYETEPTEKDKRNAADVLKKGDGYALELNRTFVALARAAGLEANVFRVAPRDRMFFSLNIPDADQMGDEIAAVTVGGKTMYFDPGTPTAPFGVVSWEKTNVHSFRVAKGEPASQPQVVAEQTAADAVVRRNATLRLNGEALEGTIVATFTGQEALRRRLRSWNEDDAARTKAFEDEARAWFPDGATVKLTELTGATSHADPVVAKFDVTLANVVSAAGSRTLLPISVFETTAKNPFAPTTRTHPIYYAYPFREEDEVKVTLPPTLAPAALPEPTTLDAGALKYASETKRSGNDLTFTRSVSVDALMVAVEHYKALRNFYSVMLSADQKPVMLVEARAK
jgi:hypothetical protein